MSIIIPDNYHAKQALESRRGHCISYFNAHKQDMRPLSIEILNIMANSIRATGTDLSKWQVKDRD